MAGAAAVYCSAGIFRTEKTKNFAHRYYKKRKMENQSSFFIQWRCIEKNISAMYKNGKTGNPMISTKEKD